MFTRRGNLGQPYSGCCVMCRALNFHKTKFFIAKLCVVVKKWSARSARDISPQRFGIFDVCRSNANTNMDGGFYMKAVTKYAVLADVFLFLFFNKKTRFKKFQILLFPFWILGREVKDEYIKIKTLYLLITKNTI